MRIASRAVGFMACALLGLPAGQARAVTSLGAAPLDLVWVDPTSAAPGAYRWARAESAAILKGAGVEVRWREAKPAEILSAGELAVIVMSGAGVRSRPGHLVLGASQTGTDAVSAVWLYAEAVGQTLGLRGTPTIGWSGRERVVFGVALGRVAAHEVIHALLPRHPHASAGLMAEEVDLQALSGARPPVDGTTRAALRTRGAAAAAELVAAVEAPSTETDMATSSPDEATN
jgi:hypothetical protein